MKNNKSIGIFCAGLDHSNRGYEKNSKLLFENLSLSSNLDVKLFKSSGNNKDREFIQKIPFRKKLRAWSKKRYNNDTTIIEERVFTLLCLIRYFLKIIKFDYVYTRNPQSALILNKFKNIFSYKVIYTNGIKMDPVHVVNISDHVHFNNIELHTEFIKQYPNHKEKTTLLPNFSTQNSEEHKNPQHIKTLKEKYNIQTKFVISCIGSISQHPKRTDYVIEEFFKLNNDWTLMLVGKGDQTIIKKGYQLFGDRFINLFFHSNDDSINEIYQLSDMTFFPSKVDAFGNVIIESMRNGTFPLCHKRELNQWILGREDFITDLNESGALKKFIDAKGLDWIKEQEAYLIDRYNTHFTWDAIKNEYLNMFS